MSDDLTAAAAVSSLPQPDFVRTGRFESVARFHCPTGCSWWHDEPTDPGPDLPPVPVDDVTGALTRHAEQRGQQMRARVEQALTCHYADQHPDVTATG